MTEKKTAKPGFFSPENLRSLTVLIVLVFCFRSSIASPYHVPTASMEPTIKVGDRLLAFKLSYNLKIPFTDIVVFEWGKPQTGDIIVFKYPKNPDIDYVKRVVGVPGDRVKFVDDILYINDTPQPRQPFDHDRSILSDIEDNKEIKELYKETIGETTHWVLQNKPHRKFGSISANWPLDGSEFLVPTDSVFVSGDNRDNSTDSRRWGIVPSSYIRGKALFVIWSMYHPQGETLPAFRFTRFGHFLI